MRAAKRAHSRSGGVASKSVLPPAPPDGGDKAKRQSKQGVS
nr:MAG TPA: hypothetical protein [Caudoviricetes sp.]